MEYFNISKQGETFHVEGFSDAVKVISIDGHKLTRRLTDMSLHKIDLDFALT
jgi:hypothetical protein